MGNLIHAEFSRIIRNTLCRIVLFAAAGIGLIFSLTSGFQQRYSGSYLLLKAFGSSMIPGLCCSFLLAFFIGSDFENRTVNHSLAAGYSRNVIVFSRFFTYIIASAAIIAVYPVMRCLGGCLRNGWGAPWPESLPFIGTAFLLCLLATLAGVSEFAAFAFLFRSTGGSMAAGIVITLGRVMIQNMICPHHPGFAQIYNKTPMMLAVGITQNALTPANCLQVVVISFIVIVSSFAVCLLLSRRRDFR